MPETAFLNALATFLRGPAGLVPAPASVGIAAPVAAAEAPAIVLALPEVARLGGGAGGGSETVTGALPIDATIDLANPFLPGAPDLSLVSANRLSLILPHGGLVRADGTEGVLGAADFTVSVNGTARPLAPPPPTGSQASVDALEGRLVFATALPATGSVALHYFAGSWEQRSTLLGGQLLLSAHAANAADAERLSVAATRALLGAQLPGLRKLALIELAAVGAPDPLLAGTRSRAARLRFEYEHIVDEPDSAGGIIRRIPLTTALQALRIDRATGMPVEERVTETG